MRLLKTLSVGLFVISVAPANAEVVYDTLDNQFVGGQWNATSESMNAQPFNLGENTTVTSVTLTMFRIGNPVGTFYVDIHDDSGLGTPGVSVGQLGSIDAGAVERAPIGGEYIFDSPVSGLTPNQQYFVVASRDGDMEWTNDLSVTWAGGFQSIGAMGAGEHLAIDPPNGATDWIPIRELPIGPAPAPVWAFTKIEAVPEPSSAADIDALTYAIIAESDEMQFDLNADGSVDLVDHTYWVKELNNTWFGDANLDGEFSSEDMVAVFQAGKYELDLDAGWAEGDWTGDLRFGSEDMVAAFQDGGYELGARAAVSAVPEPSCAILLGIGMSVLCRLRKRR